KASVNSFPVAGPATQMTCAGETFVSTFTGSGSTGAYDFVLSSLNGAACAKVDVQKTGTTTSITSTGYNIGDDSCYSSDQNRVERQLYVTYGSNSSPLSNVALASNGG